MPLWRGRFKMDAAMIGLIGLILLIVLGLFLGLAVNAAMSQLLKK
jgi:ABC-type lipoprotein release transport system permease subunit